MVDEADQRLTAVKASLKDVWERLRRLPRPRPLGWGALGILPILLALSDFSARWPVFLLFSLVLAAVLLSFVLPILNLRGLKVERVVPPQVHSHEWFSVSAVLSATRCG